MIAARSIGLVATIVGLSLFTQATLAQTSYGKIETLLAKQLVLPPDAGQYALGGTVEDSVRNIPGEVSSLMRNLPEERKTADLWTGKDKCRHFLLSGFWSGFGYLLSHRHFDYSEEKSLLLSGGVVLSLGLSKEVRDGFQADNRFSYKDLVFDVIGIGCGLFLASR